MARDVAAANVVPGAGFWDGNVFKLREFACSVGAQQLKGGVEFAQTMARVTLRSVFRAPSLVASDISVEASCWQVRVWSNNRSDLDEHFTALSGDLCCDIRRDRTWWCLEVEPDGNSAIFTLEFAKKEHKLWSTLWKLGANHHRKGYFGWTEQQQQQAPKRCTEEALVGVRVGRPARNISDDFVISREELCVDLETGDNRKNVIFRIHLDAEALERACKTVCLGDLFGIDAMERHLKIFIRGDEKSPIIMGQTHGCCVPHETRWEISWVPQAADKADGVRLPQYAPCLQVTLTKAEDHQKPWPRIIDENVHALARDSAPTIEQLSQQTIREPSPDRTNWTPRQHAKENKGKADNCFKKNDWRDAAVYYTRAIQHTPNDDKLYSNRSACYIKLKKFEKALDDANMCVSLNESWPKAYFRQGQALRGLRRWEDAITAFREGRFRDPRNDDWKKEIDKTEDERDNWDEHLREQRKQRREADVMTELNEATLVVERDVAAAASEQARRQGMTAKEASELAMKSAEQAKQHMREMVDQRRKAASMVEDDREADEPPPYRIVKEDGTVHPKGFAHADKGAYGMGMVVMNTESEPGDKQPWVEIWHPRKLRWTQGCALLRLKVQLPDSIRSTSELDVCVTSTHLRIGTVGDADPIVVGDFERKVEPEGDNFAWFVMPDEKPPLLEVILDKANADVYQTFSYTTLLWPRLFSDDRAVGEGLFEADLTDLPPHLLDKYRREQARANQQSLDDRKRRAKMTEEEIMEETARNWNREFARHGMPGRMDTKVA